MVSVLNTGAQSPIFGHLNMGTFGPIFRTSPMTIFGSSFKIPIIDVGIVQTENIILKFKDATELK